MIVNDFLVDHFPTITDYSFTANIEQEFDEIAAGKVKWQKMIEEFYRPFHKTVTSTELVERASVQNKVRELGIDPKTGKKVYVKLGRYGAYAQIGENLEEGVNTEKPKFAGLRPGQFIESITLEQALEVMKMPRDLGTFEETPVVANIGRFGPYVLHDKKFVSIPKGEDPYTITPERAVEIIQAKREADANKLIKAFPENPDITVLNGRFGPYIKAGTKNVKIPKGKEPSELTLEECVTLAANAPEKRGRFGRFGAKKAEPVKAPKPFKAKKAAKPKADGVASDGEAPAKPKAAMKKVAAKKVAAKKVAKAKPEAEE